MKFSLLIDTKMPTIEKCSCSAMFSRKEFENICNLRFITRSNYMLGCFEHEKSFSTRQPMRVISVNNWYIFMNGGLFYILNSCICSEIYV